MKVDAFDELRSMMHYAIAALVGLLIFPAAYWSVYVLGWAEVSGVKLFLAFSGGFLAGAIVGILGVLPFFREYR